MESDSEKDTNLIQELISQGDRAIQEEYLNGVLVIGSTGSGKTTLTCLLANKGLQGIETESGALCIDLIEPNDPMKIGHRRTSCTTIPNKWSDNIIVYHDCPGFGDTKSLAHEIANAYYMKKIGASHQKLKFLLLIPYGLDKTLRGTPVAELLIQVNSLILDTEKLFEGLTIVITKCPEAYKVAYFIDFLKKALNENKVFHNVSELVERLIRAPEKFCIFKMPNEDNLSIDLTDKERILACLRQSRFVATQVNIALGDQAKRKIFEIIENFQEQVTDIVIDFSRQLITRFSITEDLEQLNIAERALNIFIESENPTIEKFGEMFSELSKFVMNSSKEVFVAKDLIFKIKFFEDHSDVNHKFNVRAWIEPLLEVKLEIRENINFKNEEERKLEVEAYRKKNEEEVKRFEEIHNQMKNNQKAYEEEMKIYKEKITVQDAKIRELESGGVRSEQLMKLIEKQNQDMMTMHASSCQMNQQTINTLTNLANERERRRERKRRCSIF